MPSSKSALASQSHCFVLRFTRMRRSSAFALQRLKFLEDCGAHLRRCVFFSKCLRCPAWTSISASTVSVKTTTDRANSFGNSLQQRSTQHIQARAKSYCESRRNRPLPFGFLTRGIPPPPKGHRLLLQRTSPYNLQNIPLSADFKGFRCIPGRSGNSIAPRRLSILSARRPINSSGVSVGRPAWGCAHRGHRPRSLARRIRGCRICFSAHKSAACFFVKPRSRIMWRLAL